MCDCGQPLHYSNALTEKYVREQCANLGSHVAVHTPYGAWKIPRHYIALHGLKTTDIPVLAAMYGWEKHETPTQGASE